MCLFYIYDDAINCVMIDSDGDDDNNIDDKKYFDNDDGMCQGLNSSMLSASVKEREEIAQLGNTYSDMMLVSYT